MILLLPFATEAARLSGRIFDAAGEPLPYANVIVSGTTYGTTANASGDYSLNLDPGRHAIVYSMIGYSQLVDTVLVPVDGLRHDVRMGTATYQLKEVSISAGAEDPAYAIIRKSRDLRNSFRDEIRTYSCESYVKSTQRLAKYPKRIMGQKVEIGQMVDSLSGIYYLSESESEIAFKAPEKVRERMISSRVSGDPRGYSFNRGADLVAFNLYDPLLGLGGLSPRGIISPISDNCFFYYRYRLDGTFIENGKMINKIKVIPRRSTDPVFEGDIFIVDEDWRIYGFDLLLTKEHQIQFVDTFRIRQSAVEVSGGAYMPFSNSIYFHFSIFGFEGRGDILGVFQSYDMQPDFPDGYFSGELLAVDTSSNRRDSVYWESKRPIPLTTDEQLDYHRRDSVRSVQTSPAYLDSTDRVSNRFKPGSVLLGYSHRNSLKKRFWSFKSPVQGVQFNTVEGWNLMLEGEYRRSFGEDDGREWKLESVLRYGFSNTRFNPKASFSYRYDTRRQSTVKFEAGSEVNQFNGNNPIAPGVNTLYSLVDSRNYMKIYQQRFLDISHRTELFNGLLFSAKAGYAYRQRLENTSDYTFDDDSSHYTSNDPVTGNGDQVSFSDHAAWRLALGVRIRFGQQYINRPEARYIVGSDWPTFRIDYELAAPLTGNSVDYDKIRVSVDDEVSLGLLGYFRYRMAAGKFLHTYRVEFMDYKHFNGNRTFLSNFRTEDFMGLDYYSYSTTAPYAELHAEQHFNGLLFNKVPFIRKFRLDEVLTLHSVALQDRFPVTEIGAGIEKLNLFRVQCFFTLYEGRLSEPGWILGLKKVF